MCLPIVPCCIHRQTPVKSPMRIEWPRFAIGEYSVPDIQGNFGPPDLKGSRIFKPNTDHDKRYKAWREQQKLLRAAGLPHFETDFQYACRRKKELDSRQNRSVVASTFFFLACTGIIHSQKTSLQQTHPSSGEWEAFSSPQHCSQHRQSH